MARICGICGREYQKLRENDKIETWSCPNCDPGWLPNKNDVSWHLSVQAIIMKKPNVDALLEANFDFNKEFLDRAITLDDKAVGRIVHVEVNKSGDLEAMVELTDSEAAKLIYDKINPTIGGLSDEDRH